MMNRFITDITCACGLLGCTAVAAVSLNVGTATAAMATTTAQVATAHDPLPLVCRQSDLLPSWYYSEMCKEALRAIRENNRAEGTARTSPRHPARKARKVVEKSPPGKKSPVPAPRTRTTRPAPLAPPVIPTAPPKPSTAVRPPEAQGFDSAPQNQPLASVLLLGLLGLLIPAAAIGFTVRHRPMAAPVTMQEPAATHPPLPHQPAIDPFTGPALGLSGPGAADTARFVALTALESPGGAALVVIPRSEATLLFGLDEDELLEESAGLFIPASLDAALAYLETELAVRRDADAQTAPPRLLLIAEGGGDADRINELLVRHPGEVSAVLLGTWPGDQAVIDGQGLVTAPPTEAGRLPEQVPTMSPTEARDRLSALPGEPQRPDVLRGRRPRRR